MKAKLSTGPDAARRRRQLSAAIKQLLRALRIQLSLLNHHVGARALVNTAHAGRAYVLTGPQSLTQRHKVRLIGEAVGKKLSWEEISSEQVRQAMIAQGLPEEVPDRLLGYLADRVQQPGPTSDTVEQILGRPALSFAEWASEHTGTFRN